VGKAKSPSKAIWIEKSISMSCKPKRYLVSASAEAHVVSNCKTISALHRAQPRFSHKVKGKTLISAINKAAIALLPAAKAFISEARFEAHSSANSEVTSLKEK